MREFIKRIFKSKRVKELEKELSELAIEYFRVSDELEKKKPERVEPVAFRSRERYS